MSTHKQIPHQMVLRGLQYSTCLLALFFLGCGDDQVELGSPEVVERPKADNLSDSEPTGNTSDAGNGGETTADAGFNNADASGTSELDMAEPQDEPDAGGQPMEETDMGSDASPPLPAPRMMVSNEADFGQLAQTGLIVGPPNGFFNTDTDCHSNSGLGMCAPAYLAYDRPDACVCRADEVVISNLTVEGSRALVILAWNSITVRDLLDVGGEGEVSGPGSLFEFSDTMTGNLGGSGGSFGTRGGGDPTAVYGNASLTPLLGGHDGQSTCGAGSRGGGGGGAVQLSAGETVTILGRINAGGGGGRRGASGSSCNGGAGGGSGGAILLEAPDVRVYGELSANGGGGGGGGTSSYLGFMGNDAVSVARADGGQSESESTCYLQSDVHSGFGGDGATASFGAGNGGSSDRESGCIGATVYAGAGGDGGGLGRIRVNSENSQNCVCAGSFSPSPTYGAVQFE